MHEMIQTVSPPTATRRIKWVARDVPGCRPERRPLSKETPDRLTPGRGAGTAQPISDDRLLELFHRRPRRAWRIFLERYAERMLGQLRGLGFDRDEAMDRFVFVCERLAHNKFQRLRQVRATGDQGELVPWLRQVVKNAAIDWGWSQAGRRRLFRSIEGLGELEQRVFKLHFWTGLGPAAIVERLRAEGRSEVGVEQVFDALEKVFERLDEGQKWRLLSQLSRRRPAGPVGVSGTESGIFEPLTREPDPETELLCAEQARVLAVALSNLPARDRLIFRLRYDDGLSLTHIAAVVSLGLTSVKTSLRKSREALRAAVEEALR